MSGSIKLTFRFQKDGRGFGSFSSFSLIYNLQFKIPKELPMSNLQPTTMQFSLYDLYKEHKEISRHDKLVTKVKRMLDAGIIKDMVSVSVTTNNTTKTTLNTYTLSEADYNKVKLHILTKRKVRDIKNSNLLYVITDGVYNKIGIATDSSWSRLKSLQTGNARRLACEFELKTDNAREMETVLHNYFSDRRMCGEWFDVSLSEILQKISEVK